MRAAAAAGLFGKLPLPIIIHRPSVWAQANRWRLPPSSSQSQSFALLSSEFLHSSSSAAPASSRATVSSSPATTLASSNSSHQHTTMELQDQTLSKFKRAHIDSLRKKLENINCKTPQEQDVTLEKDNESKLARICVRSGAKNALSGKMISKLTDIIDQLYEWPEGKGVLLHGFNGTFCSGSDLVSVRETANLEGGLELAQIMQYNLLRLQHLPMISVALVEGYALGGGAELATAADLRLMTSSARIGFVHIKVGVCCGWGGGSRLVQLLGPARALDLLASGRLVDATEAKQMGLSNETIADGADTHRAALEFLASRTVGAKETYAALKSMLNSARTLPLLESLKVEAQLFASTWGKEAHLRALDGNIKHKQ